MKKLSLSLLLMLGLFATVFISCNDDDDEPPLIDPIITDIDPETGPVNTPVTITGTSFGSNPIVRFGTVTATNSNVSATSITTSVPTGATGAVQVTVENDGETSNGVTFTVTEDDDGDGGNGETLATIGSALDTAADESLTTLKAALDAAGLTETLNDGGRSFTLFAPNNDAFAALLEALELENLDAVIAELTQEGVAELLSSHVVEDSLSSVEAMAAAGGDSLETLSGAMLGIRMEGESLLVNGAQIVQADIFAGNGVIHVIDSVINLPPVDGGDGEDVIVPDPTQVADDDPARDVALELIDNFNAVQDVGVSLTNPIPSSNLEFVTSQLAAYSGDFFDEVAYKGAFDPSGTATWMDGWTLLSRGGYLGGTASGAAAYSADEITGDASILVELPQEIDGNRTLSADSIYRIDGYTFVENGELAMEAGTRVIAETDPSTGDPISALIITRSATINAMGSAEAPIILTSENDTGGLNENSAGEWGGLVVLGEGRVNKEGASLLQIEGIATNIPALYGQENGEFIDDDNSGTIQYVSIRYTGDAIAPGNELQGLTLGGVGSGTTIQYVESFASSDDGIEIFGGSPNIKYFAVGFAQDDSYDFDLGFNGNIQFAYALQGQSADNLIEWDGADDDDNAIFSDPTLYNMTLVGTAVADQALVLRDNTAGVLANSIIVSNGTRGLVVENLEGDDVDSYQRLIDGEIELLNNLWFLGDTFVNFNSTESGIVQTVVPD